MNPKWSDSQVQLKSQSLFSCMKSSLYAYILKNLGLEVLLITHEFQMEEVCWNN